MAGVVLAYHKPGSPEGHAIIERLASAASSVLGLPVRALTFEELAEDPPRDCGSGYILTLARGGHYYEARRALSGCGRVHGPVPLLVTATHVAAWAAREGCPGAIVYHEARRYRGEQEQDYDDIARLASLILGAMGRPCRLEARGHRSAGGGGVRIGLLPGRRRGIAVLGGEPGFSLVLRWILGLPL